MTEVSIQRIGHVVNDVNGSGGVTRVAYNLLRHMPGPVADFDVYSLKPDKAHRKSVWSGTDAIAALGATVIPGVDRRDTVARIDALIAWLRDRHVAIAHLHSYQPTIAGGLAALATGTPYIVHYHNYYDDKWRDDDSLLTSREVALNARRLVACSKAVADHTEAALSLAAGSIDVLPNGVDTARFRPIPREEARRRLGWVANDRIVAQVGRVCEQKAQVNLVSAIPAVLSRFPDTRFVFAGETKDREEMARINDTLQQLGVADHVEFLGYIGNIEDVYAAADVVALPSRWEGLPLCLLEAMAVAAPVVASDIAPILEVSHHDDDVLIVREGDIGALAGGINAMLSSPDLSARLATAAARTAARHDWSGRSRQLQAWYDEVRSR